MQTEMWKKAPYLREKPSKEYLAKIQGNFRHSNVDICDCLNNTSYYNSNEKSCDKAINKKYRYKYDTRDEYGYSPHIRFAPCH